MPRSAPWVWIAFAGGLAAGRPAAAGWVAGSESALPPQGDVAVLAAGPWGGGAALALIGPTAAKIVDPATGDVLATAEGGGVAADLVDHDGDGTADLVLCGPDGVRWARGNGTGLDPIAVLSSEPCEAMARVVREGGVRWLVSAARDVWTWPIGEGGALGQAERFGGKLDGPPLLAAIGARFAVASTWGVEIQESSEWGRSTYTAQGPIRGLAASPRSWAWSVMGTSVVEDVTRARVEVAASPGELKHADLDGDGVPEVLVVHPNAVGLLGEDGETLLQAPGGVDGVAAYDVDGDACPDIAVLGDDKAVHVLHGTCTPKVLVEAGGTPIEVVLDERDQLIDAWVGQPLRVQFRDPQQEGTRFSGRGGPEGFAIAEDGLVTWLPAADDVGEWTVSVRMWGGADLVRVVPIRMAVHMMPGTGPSDPNTLVLGEQWPTVQVLVGETAVLRLQDGISDADTFRWRGGPPGIQIRTDGLTRYTAMEEHVGQWRVDMKLKGKGGTRKTSFFVRVAPRALVSAPQGSPAADEAQRQASVARQPGFLQPRGCVVSLGFAGGLTGTMPSWENVGRPVYASFSPVIAATCEGGSPRGLQWFAGADSAPIYAYVLNENAIGVHTLVGTVGFSLGSDAFRVGPYFSAGILLTGFGVRIWWLPFVTRGGVSHGFELRTAYVLAATPSGEAMLMYGWRFGRPR